MTFDLDPTTVDTAPQNILDRAVSTLTTKVVNTEKTRHYTINAALFLQVLQREEGVFVWTDGPNRGDKFSHVFEALATSMPGYENMGLVEKNNHIQEYAHRLRQGCYDARRYYNDESLGTIYCVPQNKESSQPTVVTVFAEYKLENGMTAAEMQILRDRKAMEGQIRSSTHRIVSANGGDTVKAMTILSEEVGKACVELETTRLARIAARQKLPELT